MFAHKKINPVLLADHLYTPFDTRLLRFLSLYMTLSVYMWPKIEIRASKLSRYGRAGGKNMHTYPASSQKSKFRLFWFDNLIALRRKWPQLEIVD